MLIFKHNITQNFVQHNDDCFFVYGDNVEQKGQLGYKYNVRKSNNAIAIPTKWNSANDDTSFFKDFDSSTVIRVLSLQFDKIEKLLSEGKTVYFPAEGLIHKNNKLMKTSPRIHYYIQNKIKYLKQNY